MQDISVKLNEFPTIQVSLGNTIVSTEKVITSHSELEDRDLADQHPISAITGLSDALDAAVDSEELENAVTTALTDAKNQGDFNGADGKSAYAYARDGGYAGTEAEFAAKMADETPGIHIGTDEPTDDSVIWIDTDEEEPTAVTPDFSAHEGEDGYIANRTHFVDKSGVVHKLNNKYIDADWMATSEEVIKTTEVIAEQTLTSGVWSNLQFDLEPGIVYDVYINGLRYVCTARASGNAVALGNNTSMTLNDYPFCIYWAGGTAQSGMFFKNSSLSYPLLLKVTEHSYTVYNKLPEEFLPDSAARKSDIPAPLIGTTNEVTPSEVAEALAAGRTVAIAYEGSADGVITFTSFVIGEDAVSSSETMIETLHQLRGELSSDIWSFTSTPVSSGGSADIDVTASVGQTIVVEEVDESGKPTKWRAAEYQPRTHWEEEKVIFPETALEDTGEGEFLAAESALPVVAGEEYIVNFNGTEYTVQCVDMSDSVGGAPAKACVLGSMEFPPPDGEPPFGIMVFENVPDMGTMTLVVTGSEYVGTSITLGIKQIVANKIPHKYYDRVFYVDVTGTDGSYTSDTAVADIEAAFEADIPIYVRLSDNNTTSLLLLISRTAAGSSLLYLATGFGTNNYVFSVSLYGSIENDLTEIGVDTGAMVLEESLNTKIDARLKELGLIN